MLILNNAASISRNNNRYDLKVLTGVLNSKSYWKYFQLTNPKIGNRGAVSLILKNFNDLILPNYGKEEKNMIHRFYENEEFDQLDCLVEELIYEQKIFR